MAGGTPVAFHRFANRRGVVGVPRAMTRRLTGSLVVCATAGLFTLGTLLVNPRPARPPVPPAATGTTVASASAASATLAIDGFRFAPLTVRPGATVKVTNGDGDEHTVSASAGAFDVRVRGGGTATFTAPRAPGSYAFVCDIHPSMRGRLVVA
jgi:plastocyanin